MVEVLNMNIDDDGNDTATLRNITDGDNTRETRKVIMETMNANTKDKTNNMEKW